MNDATGSPNDAAKAAADAFASGMANDPFARRHGRLLDPVPVLSPAGDPAGWIVPVGHVDKLLGFVQLSADGHFHRYSAFARRGDSAAGCPSLRDWLDAQIVLERARELVGDARTFQRPVLSYDRSPDRLAWLVRSTGRYGDTRVVYVAGTSAWIGPTDPPETGQMTG